MSDEAIRRMITMRQESEELAREGLRRYLQSLAKESDADAEQGGEAGEHGAPASAADVPELG